MNLSTHFELLINSVFIILCIVVFIGFLYKRRTVQINTIYHQQEALMGLYQSLNPNAPLPPTRGWSASPDALAILVEEILFRRPESVLEFGGGVSTIVIAYALKKCSAGQLITIEHDKEYAERLCEQIRHHGLDEYVNVLVYPIRESEIEGRAFKWYELDFDSIHGPIDFMFIDGPPGELCKMARWPSMIKMHHLFSEQAVIFLDDSKRKDEQMAIKEWKLLFGKKISIREERAEKGLAKIIWNRNLD